MSYDVTGNALYSLHIGRHLTSCLDSNSLRVLTWNTVIKIGGFFCSAEPFLKNHLGEKLHQTKLLAVTGSSSLESVVWLVWRELEIVLPLINEITETINLSTVAVSTGPFKQCENILLFIKDIKWSKSPKGYGDGNGLQLLANALAPLTCTF